MSHVDHVLRPYLRSAGGGETAIVEQLDSRARSRRRFLAAGAGAIGALALARALRVGDAVMPAAAAAFRPGPDATRGSSSVCATCGRSDHTMLNGACVARRIRA